MSNLKIVNVSWSPEELTITLAEKRPAGSREWSRAESMLLVDRLEKFLAADPDILEASVVMVDGKPTNIPIVTPAEKLREGSHVFGPGPTPAQEKLNAILGQDKPAEEIAKDIQDVSALNQKAQLDIEDTIRERQQKQTEAPVPPEDNFKVDMGGHPSELVPPAPDPNSGDQEAESEMAFGVFEDSLREVHDVPSAVRVWLESQQLFTKFPPLRDRARLVMAAHLGKAIGVGAPEASEKIREALLARQKLMQSAGAPTSTEPQQKTAAETPAVAELTDQQRDFLAKMAAEQKQVMGTVLKVACQVNANPAREVTRDLVQEFLLSMVGKHPLLAGNGTEAEQVAVRDEIRGLMDGTRFKLFAAAAKVKIVEGS